MNEIDGESDQGKEPSTNTMDDEQVLCRFVRIERQAGGNHIETNPLKCSKWKEHSKRMIALYIYI